LAAENFRERIFHQLEGLAIALGRHRVSVLLVFRVFRRIPFAARDSFDQFGCDLIASIESEL